MTESWPIKASLFYLILAFLALIAPSFIIWTGTYFTVIAIYLVMILASLLVIYLSRIRLNIGSLVFGFLLSFAAMGSFIVIAFATGLATPGPVGPYIYEAIIGGIFMQAFVASAEELSFRGYILNAIGALGFVPAAIISSIGFTLLHLPSIIVSGTSPVSAVIAICTIMIGGILFAILYKRSGILTAIGFHFGWNFLQYHLFSFGSAGLGTGIGVTLNGPDILTGGAFGPEASLIGLCAMLATLTGVWYYYKKADDSAAKRSDHTF